MNEQLIRCLERAANINDDRCGIRFLDQRERATWVSWPEFFQRAQSAAGMLAEQGVKPGERVAIILPTCAEFMDAFLGCQLLGAIPVPLYPPVRLGRLDEYFERTAAMLKAVDAVALLSNARVMRVLGKVLPLYRPRLGILDATLLKSGPPKSPNWTGPDHLAMVQFSSGTTVDPKPVALTHRQILANAHRIKDLILSVEPDNPVGVSWLPLYHDMGLIGCILPAIIGPGPLTLIPPEIFLANPAIWLRALSRYQGTVSPAPNFAYALCNERVSDAQMEGCDLSGWKMALCGAEPISPDTLREFQQRFSRWQLPASAITPVYGLSEASLAVTFSALHSPMQSIFLDREKLQRGHAVASTEADALELVSVGAALPDFQLEIRDKAGNVLPDGREGLLFVSGPSVCEGYFHRDDSPIENGLLNTGDLGFMLDGQLYITGRAKDVIVLNGQNHAPHEIERALDGVAGIRKGCAAAIGDFSEGAEKLLVFAEYRELHEQLAEDCRKAITAACSVTPSLVVILEPGTLPRTSSGKIRRSETLKRWRQGQLTAPEKITPWLLAGALAGSWKARLSDRLKRRPG